MLRVLRGFLCLTVLLAIHRECFAESALKLIQGVYMPDEPFPQFMHLWLETFSAVGPTEDWPPNKGSNVPLGGFVHVYVSNPLKQAVRVQDVMLEGLSLKESVAISEDKKAAGIHPASIYFSKKSKADVDKLVSLGEPQWWKVDPAEIPAGGMADIVIRLRAKPRTDALQLEVTAGTSRVPCRVVIADRPPYFADIAASPASRDLFAYLRFPKKPGVKPSKILLDGADVTTKTSVHADPSLDTLLIAVKLDQALSAGSFHWLQAVMPDSAPVIASFRSWGGELVYGMWGYINQGETPEERVNYYLTDMERHNINTLMHSYGSDVTKYLRSPEGEKYRRDTGMRVMVSAPGNMSDPQYLFLLDEPDAHDYAVKDLPAVKRLGSLAQALVQRSEEFRTKSPDTPQLLNIDNTFKPDNWYTYGQLPDVYCADPYYQEQQRIVYTKRPGWMPSFVKPTYVYAVASICHSACSPRPLHLILNSVKHDVKGEEFRYATPEEKRVEVYYALAGGTKSFSYWWYTPYGEFRGCGAADPEAKRLWKEIGLLGAEVRTAGPLISRSSPVTLVTKQPKRVWISSLLSGDDAIILLVVNDNMGSDRLGTVVVPQEKVTITVQPPAWLKPTIACEISYQGVKDISWKPAEGGVSLDLGRLDVARMFVLTSNTQWPKTLQERLTAKCAKNVEWLLKQ